MKIAVGSKNKAKIEAVARGLERAGILGEIIPVDAPSSVSSMPFSDEETRQGAKNRAEYSLEHGEADFAIGLEGGVAETPDGLFLINWGALAQKGKPIIAAGGARIRLPEEIAVKLREGEELGPVMQAYSQKENVRSEEGAIGIFTDGLVNRSEMFTHILMLLLGQRAWREGEQ